MPAAIMETRLGIRRTHNQCRPTRCANYLRPECQGPEITLGLLSSLHQLERSTDRAELPIGVMMRPLTPSIPSVGSDSPGGGGEMLWVLCAPCGCSTGWFGTSHPHKGPLLDEASVWEVSGYGPVYQSRMRAEGWT